MIILNQKEIESKIESGELPKDFYIHTQELKKRFKNKAKVFRWLVLQDDKEALYLFAKSKLALIRKLQKIDEAMGELIENAESIRAIEKIEEDFKALENKVEVIKSQEKPSRLDNVVMDIALISFFLSFASVVISSEDNFAFVSFILGLLILIVRDLINRFKK